MAFHFQRHPLYGAAIGCKHYGLPLKIHPALYGPTKLQFFLVRSIEEKHLKFGLMINCPSVKLPQYELDPDLDGMRLIEQLENNTNFASLINLLASQEDWGIEVNEWNKNTYFPQNASELLALLKRCHVSKDGVYISNVLFAPHEYLQQAKKSPPESWIPTAAFALYGKRSFPKMSGSSSKVA